MLAAPPRRLSAGLPPRRFRHRRGVELELGFEHTRMELSERHDVPGENCHGHGKLGLPRLIAPVGVQVRRERAAKLFDDGVRRRQVRKTPAIKRLAFPQNYMSVCGLMCREL